MSDRGGQPRAALRVAIIQRQGKFLVAEPFFTAGPRLAISRDKRFDVGDLVELAGTDGRAPAVRGDGAARGGRGSRGGSAGPTSPAT